MTTAAEWLVASAQLTTQEKEEIAVAVLAAAQVTPIHSNVQQINDAEVIGDGTDGNDWRGVGVQPQ